MDNTTIHIVNFVHTKCAIEGYTTGCALEVSFHPNLLETRLPKHNLLNLHNIRWETTGRTLLP